MSPWIEFVRLPWDDEAGHFVLRASDGRQVAEEEFYADPADVAAFGAALETFPRDRAAEAKLEVGEKGPRHAWMWLRVYLYDATGHAAVVVDVGTNSEDPWQSQARFSIRCEVASLNAFGRALTAWARDNEHGALRHELYPGR